ncbi:MAG TPA: Gfo/Idh/MocA family oxidoreductase [Casimicrobiaceae bacterium]|nr:Gfo/Idh/MocA family oxidoreductase [Casimicrobiaceae bacterium]
MSDSLRIAVVGAGMIGRRHIELVRAGPECVLAAIADPAPAAEALAADAGVPHYASLESLLTAARRVDGIILATPNALHAAQALQCIAAGIPVLVEKPVAHTVEAGAALCDAVERSHARLLVGHHRRHSAIMARACEVVASRALGPLVAVMGSALFYKPDHYFDEAPWRREPGGGPVLINMIHEIDNLRALCGEIAGVQALASSARRGFPVEDTVAINLRFASGALGTFMLSDTAASARSWEQTSRENKSYASYPDEDCYLIAGTDGSLAIPTMRLRRYPRAEDRSWWQPFDTRVLAVENVDPLARQLWHFCAVIGGSARPLVTARDGLQNLVITEAIVKAARTGRAVATA